jgi:hypothetical protein
LIIFETILINTPGFSKNLIKKLMKEYSVEDFRAPPKKDKKKEENNHPKPHPYIVIDKSIFFFCFTKLVNNS